MWWMLARILQCSRLIYWCSQALAFYVCFVLFESIRTTSKGRNLRLLGPCFCSELKSFSRAVATCKQNSHRLKLRLFNQPIRKTWRTSHESSKCIQALRCVNVRTELRSCVKSEVAFFFFFFFFFSSSCSLLSANQRHAERIKLRCSSTNTPSYSRSKSSPS